MTWKQGDSKTSALLHLGVWFWTSQILEIPNYITYVSILECTVLETKGIFKNVSFSPLFPHEEPGLRVQCCWSGTGLRSKPSLPLGVNSGGGHRTKLGARRSLSPSPWIRSPSPRSFFEVLCMNVHKLWALLVQFSCYFNVISDFTLEVKCTMTHPYLCDFVPWQNQPKPSVITAQFSYLF